MATDTGGSAYPMPFTAVAAGVKTTLTVPYPGDTPAGMTLLDYAAIKMVAGVHPHGKLPDAAQRDLIEYGYELAVKVVAEKRRREEKGLEEGPDEKRP